MSQGRFDNKSRYGTQSEAVRPVAERQIGAGFFVESIGPPATAPRPLRGPPDFKGATNRGPPWGWLAQSEAPPRSGQGAQRPIRGRRTSYIVATTMYEPDGVGGPA